MAYNPFPTGISSASNSVPIVFPNGVIDVFSKVQTSSAFNDIDCQFYRDDPNAILSVTTAGGGTVTQTLGLAQFASSTGTTGSIIGESLDKISYHPGSEIYALFTAAWLDGGVATSVQRIGLFDTNEGMFIGYENTSFGITVRTGAADTTVTKASFNVDTLSGDAASKFTRSGVPEAIDLTKLNIFRIRFSWLGVAPIYFEVVSPDGEWVLFHVIKQPNLSALPHIQNPDLAIRVQITKTAGATDIRMNSACWGGGCTYSHHETADTSTLGTAVNSATTYYTKGLKTARVYIGTTTTGTIIFEATIDGKNWFTAPTVIDRNLGGIDLLVTTSVTPASGNFYTIGLSGFRAFRVRTATTLGATVALSAYLDEDVTMISVISNVAAPHNIGFAHTWKSANYTTTQTGAAMWTPASGKKINLTRLAVSSYGTTAGRVIIWIGASADTTYSAGTDQLVWAGSFAPSANAKPGMIDNYTLPIQAVTADHVLKITTDANISLDVSMYGYES